MKKTIPWFLGVIVVIIVGFFALNSYIYNEKQGDSKPATSYKDATYIIDGEQITLKDGVSETEGAPGSASKNIIRYFGNEVLHDLDADGREDVVFLVTQETGGTGMFVYVVAALNKETGYVGSQGLFLGDRIAPQTTEMSREPGKPNVVIVNYADRAPGESFATPPSVGKSIWIKLDPETMQFGEVVQNFEGESATGESQRVAAGYISGHIDIGPFCPVQREGEPCIVPAEAYTSRTVAVYQADKVTLKEKIKIDTEGNYKIAIGPGVYWLQVQPAGIGPGEKKNAVVKSFETTTINFDIDTGIR